MRSRRSSKRLKAYIPAALSALMLTGCASLGSQRIGIDRSDYTQRLRDSEKSQLLSNIVALRFGDAPLFLNVTSVISQYTRESSGTIDVTLSPASDSDGGTAHGGLLLRETPTVTYTPVSGERFAHTMLAPMPPASVLAMMEAGWASDDLLRITVRTINGVSNASHSTLFEQPSDGRFDQVAGAMRRLQRDGAVSIRVKQNDKSFSGTARLAPTLSDADRADLDLLGKLLGFKFVGGQIDIVFASRAANPSELAITTRSMFEVLSEMGQGVDLTGDGAFNPKALIRVHSGGQAPADSHVAVKYKGRWFWIANDDQVSMRAFLLTQVLLSLNDQEGASRAPLVTIPAG